MVPFHYINVAPDAVKRAPIWSHCLSGSVGESSNFLHGGTFPSPSPPLITSCLLDDVGAKKYMRRICFISGREREREGGRGNKIEGDGVARGKFASVLIFFSFSPPALLFSSSPFPSRDEKIGSVSTGFLRNGRRERERIEQRDTEGGPTPGAGAGAGVGPGWVSRRTDSNSMQRRVRKTLDAC